MELEKVSKSKFSYWRQWSNMNKLKPRPNRSGGSSDDDVHMNKYMMSSSRKNKAGRTGHDDDSIRISGSTSLISSFALKITTSCAKFVRGTFVSIDHQRPASVEDDLPIVEQNKEKVITNDDEKPLRERQKPLRERKAAALILSDDEKNSTSINKELADEGTCIITDDHESHGYEWANIYRPKTLEDFICNRTKALWLKEKVKGRGNGCGHLIFQGPPGVGKTTMIRAMLPHSFPDHKIQVMSEFKEINLKGEAIERIKVRIKKSAQHYEIRVSDLKGYEKHVIVELMKETRMLDATDPTCECTAIVLFEADRLGTDTMMYIKWLLERYKGKNKVLFSCSDISKLQPLMSLCNVVNLLHASREETVQVLEFIAGKESIILSRKMAEKITDKANNNLRQAIRSFEATWHARHVMEEDQEPLTGWEEDIATIAKNIIDERTPQQLYIIRGKLQNLIEHQVSPEFIFQFLVRELKKHLPDGMHAQLDALYAEYTRDDKGIFHRDKLFNGCKNSAEETGKDLHDPVNSVTRNNIHHFLRIEEFTARFMSWYNYQSRMSNAADELPT